MVSVLFKQLRVSYPISIIVCCLCADSRFLYAEVSHSWDFCGQVTSWLLGKMVNRWH